MIGIISKFSISSAIHVMIILIAFSLVLSGQSASLLLLIPPILVDFWLSRRPERNVVKIGLLFQGLAISMIINTQESLHHLLTDSEGKLVSKTSDIQSLPRGIVELRSHHNQDSIFSLKSNGIEMRNHLRSGDVLDPKARDKSNGASSQAISAWLLNKGLITVDPPQNSEEGGKQLSVAVFALDVAAVRHLLEHSHVSANSTDGFGRTPFSSLALVGTLSEGHARSHVYNILKGKESWLNHLLVPPLPRQLSSVRSADIISSLSGAVLDVSEWLIRYGASANEPDNGLSTPLHYAAYHGVHVLVEVLVERGANLNAVNDGGRSPLHFGAALGHSRVCDILIKVSSRRGIVRNGKRYSNGGGYISWKNY